MVAKQKNSQVIFIFSAFKLAKKNVLCHGTISKICYCWLELLIYPWNNDLTQITDELKKIEPTIDFIYELETNNTLLLFRCIINRW